MSHMSTDAILKEILALSPAQRFDLVERIWESLSAKLDQELDVPPAHQNVLDARLERHAQNPAEVVDWPTLRASVEPKP